MTRRSPDLLTKPEVAMLEAAAAVQGLRYRSQSHDPLLLEAITLIDTAREKVSEYVDKQFGEPR